MDIGFPTRPGTTARAPAPTGATYLVTGGAGFIGSHLTEALLGRGYRAIVLDDLSTGAMENLARMVDHPGLRVVTGSIRDELSSTSGSTLATRSSTWPPRSVSG